MTEPTGPPTGTTTGTTTGPTDPVAALPTGAALRDALLELSCPHEDIDTLLALRPLVDEPSVAQRIRDFVAEVRDHLGVPSAAPPSLPPGPDGPLRRWYWVFALLAAAPDTRRHQADRGVPREVTDATLRDVGRHLAAAAWGTGERGLPDNIAGWLWLHVTAGIHDLGRLQFQPTVWHDELVLSVHIPRFSGPLDPAACDAAFAAAADFYATHLPEFASTKAICTSWLLDPALPDLLGEDSNIVRFQRRFTATRAPRESDDAVSFVFGPAMVGRPYADLPRDTRLQRVVAERLERGERWGQVTGRTTMPAPR